MMNRKCFLTLLRNSIKPSSCKSTLQLSTNAKALEKRFIYPKLQTKITSASISFWGLFSSKTPTQLSESPDNAQDSLSSSKLASNESHDSSGILPMPTTQSIQDSTTHSTASNLLSSNPVSSLLDSYSYTTGLNDPALIKPAPEPPSELITSIFPVDLAEEFIVWVHTITGLPWYLSLAIAAFAVRSLIIPFSFIQQRSVAKLSHHHLSLTHIRLIYTGLTTIPKNRVIDRISFFEAISACWGLFRKLSSKQKLYFSPLLLPLAISIPLLITFNSACRQLMHGINTSKIAETLAVEGPFFCPDLTQPDPSLYLPLIAFTATAANIHYLFRRYQPPSPSSRTLKKKLFQKLHYKQNNKVDKINTTNDERKRIGKIPLILQLGVACILPFTLHLPASLFIYWTCAMTVGIVQNMLMRSQFMRRLAGFYKPKQPLQTVDIKCVSSESSPPKTIPPLDKKFVQAILADTKREKEMREL